MIEIRLIAAEKTHLLRNLVLRPGQPVAACAWPGDESPYTFHVGGFVEEELVAIATVMLEPVPWTSDSGDDIEPAFRLRGMATHPERRGEGHGRALLEFCIRRTSEIGGSILWCNARTSAVEFYRRAGFEVHGKPFEVAGIGPHVVMSIRCGTT